MVIERLRPDDSRTAFEAIRKLKGADETSGLTAESTRRFLSQPRNVLIVASSDDEPVGFLLAYRLDRMDGERPMVCLYEIEVSEPFRRRGVGRAMIESLKGVCGEVNATKAWAITQRSNEAALALYRSTGADLAAGDGDVTVVWNAQTWAIRK
jgi:ribosomal protein S18 acetylase RimI-like enzyme